MSTIANPIQSAPRASGLSITPLWTLYTLTLRQHLRGKRWLVMAGLFLLPAALAIVIRATAKDVPGIGLEFIFVGSPGTELEFAL